MSRIGEFARSTKETRIQVTLNLDGTGTANVTTGLGFLDHMLENLARHSSFDIQLQCQGDLNIDDHHTAEDCAIALGRALDDALGDRAGIQRFGAQYAPLDESLSRVVVDLCGRAWSEIHLDLKRERIGDWATENITHFFRSLSASSRSTIHVDVLRGDNDHHKVEASFKALAMALRQATAACGQGVPSTKGVLG
jgi:imidazoleglycerol phosphate dehydratase HisB